MHYNLKLQGGAALTNKKCTQNKDAINYAGLRLRNPNFYCFLNCAVNYRVTNSKIMNEINKQFPLHNWYRYVLQHHCNMTNYTIALLNENKLQNAIDNFFTGSQCTADHTVDCFTNMKYSYNTRRSMV